MAKSLRLANITGTNRPKVDSLELDRWQSVLVAMKAARNRLKQQHLLALDATLERISRH
ncbi:hypothetical protein [uncultured Thiocystis sp.]|jgi:hypothetical protein|uniref:hypothetical protein n=1 Tax=uncultured Thiocystis sp. TaxID=1202134 RepID=UPI0025CEA2BB|nr:hypothetical protein [uncultured Thiocystis sp.]